MQRSWVILAAALLVFSGCAESGDTSGAIFEVVTVRTEDAGFSTTQQRAAKIQQPCGAVAKKYRHTEAMNPDKNDEGKSGGAGTSITLQPSARTPRQRGAIAAKSQHTGAVELDKNGDGKLDEEYIPDTIARSADVAAAIAAVGGGPEGDPVFTAWDKDYGDLTNRPSIPTSLSSLSEDSTHRTVTDTEKSTWSAKQDALGYTAENAANKGVVNGYAGLGADGKVPATQLPDSAGTDDQTAIEVMASPWGAYSATNVQTLMQEVDTELRALLGAGGSFPSWLPSSGPTADNQIIQATGEGTSAWTSIIDGLINDTGTGVDDLLSASEINSRIATSAGAKQGLDPDLTIAAGADTAANSTCFGKDALGTVGFQALPSGSTLDVPTLTEAQEGTATEPRAWTAQRVAQAIVALAPAGSGGESYYEIDGGSSASVEFLGIIDGGTSL